jgi:hypothetical protein
MDAAPAGSVALLIIRGIRVKAAAALPDLWHAALPFLRAGTINALITMVTIVTRVSESFLIQMFARRERKEKRQDSPPVADVWPITTLSEWRAPYTVTVLAIGVIIRLDRQIVDRKLMPVTNVFELEGRGRKAFALALAIFLSEGDAEVTNARVGKILPTTLILCQYP